MFECATLQWAGGLQSHQAPEFTQVVNNIPVHLWCRVLVRNGFEVDDHNFPHGVGPATAVVRGKFCAWRSIVGLPSYTLLIRKVPSTKLVLQCNLHACQGTSIEAEFWTLGGKACTPKLALRHKCIRVRCLRRVARETALALGLLRSRCQQIQLVFPEFTDQLPNDTVLWSRQIWKEPSTRRNARNRICQV